MSENDPTINTRTKRYHKAQRSRGHTLIRIWVPTHQIDDFKARALQARQDHNAKTKELLDF